jgi:hypothetical protein
MINDMGMLSAAGLSTRSHMAAHHSSQAIIQVVHSIPKFVGRALNEEVLVLD